MTRVLSFSLLSLAIFFTLFCSSYTLLISDASNELEVSYVLFANNGSLIRQVQTTFSTVNQYTGSIGNPQNKKIYALVSNPPGIIWPNRTYSIGTTDLQTGKTSLSPSLFHLPGIYPYGISLGPNGKVIVSAQDNTIMQYYLVDPISGISEIFTKIDIRNGFIFPNSMIYDSEIQTMFHPYCNEPEQFVGVVIVDFKKSVTSLVTAAELKDQWFRPTVLHPITKQLIGLVRKSSTTDETSLATFDWKTQSLSLIGSPFSGSSGLTFEGADISTSGDTLYVTGSKGIFGFGQPYFMTVNTKTGSGSIQPFAVEELPVQSLTYFDE